MYKTIKQSKKNKPAMLKCFYRVPIWYKEQFFNLIIHGDLSSFATFSILYTLLEDAQAMHALSLSSIKSGYCVH